VTEIILPHKCDFKPNGPNPEDAICRFCGKSILADAVIPEFKPEKPLKFIKYRSIHNVDEFIIEKVKEQLLDDGEWVCLNKYHGTNFSVWCSADNLFYAQKNGPFTKKDNPYKFFNLEGRPKYVERIAKEVQLYYGKNIALFFELFGGRYSHPDVKKLPEDIHPRVQKGVFYCPHLDIRLIDIMVEGVYVDYDEFKTIADNHNIKRAKEIFRGSFDECLNISCEFEDETYKEYSLPPLDDNFSEGLIIKPVKERSFKNGERLVLKNKHPLFSEKQREPKATRTNVPDEAVLAVVSELSKSITQPRLVNVLSHGVEVKDSKDFAKVCGLMTQDILKENSDFISGIDEDLLKKAKKVLFKEVGIFIKPTVVSMIKESQFNE
jgi:Rnl2 family RNA ligase